MSALDFFVENPVFTAEEFDVARVSAGRSRQTSLNLLRYHVAEGHIVRVHRGLYATPLGAQDPFLLASKVASDAVIAYHAALQYRGCVYSIWRRYTVLTRRRKAPIHFHDMEFVSIQAPVSLRQRSDLGGFITAEPRVGLDSIVRTTTFERTLVDVLDAPEHGGGWEEIWRSLAMVGFFDIDAIIEYALTLGSALTIARVGVYLERHRERLMVEEHHLARLERHRPPSPRYFDPAQRRGGLAKRWNLYVPVEIVGETWEESL